MNQWEPWFIMVRNDQKLWCFTRGFCFVVFIFWLWKITMKHCHKTAFVFEREQWYIGGHCLCFAFNLMWFDGFTTQWSSFWLILTFLCEKGFCWVSGTTDERMNQQFIAGLIHIPETEFYWCTRVEFKSCHENVNWCFKCFKFGVHWCPVFQVFWDNHLRCKWHMNNNSGAIFWSHVIFITDWIENDAHSPNELLATIQTSEL